MIALEVFFDYACPYCLQGHGYLSALIRRYPQIELIWRPCEAHPRPDRYGPHSDLCARGMYVALAQGVDLAEYHRRMYRAVHADRLDIEDLCIVSEIVDGLLDARAFFQALSGGDYAAELQRNNNLAWHTYGFSAVPAYRMGGAALVSVENIGVTQKQLTAFLAQATGEHFHER